MPSSKTFYLLVAGNDATIHKKLSRALIRQGIEIVFAVDPKSLDNQLQNPGNFDAVLVDSDAMDVESITKIKNTAHTLNKMPLLILTSEFRTSSIALALQSGFDEFLAKPVSKETIKACLIRKNN